MKHASAKLVEIRGVIRPGELADLSPAVFTLGPWTLTIEEGNFLASIPRDIPEATARKDLGQRLARFADEQAHRQRQEISVLMGSYSRVWADGSADKRDLDSGVGRDRVAQIFHGTDALIVTPPVFQAPRQRKRKLAKLLDRIYVLQHNAYASPAEVVRSASAIVDMVHKETNLISSSIEKDMGHLANGADIGTFSRHPELYGTDLLPEDAAVWVRDLMRSIVEGVAMLGEGGNLNKIDKGLLLRSNLTLECERGCLSLEGLGALMPL